MSVIKIERYMLQQRIEIVKIHYKKCENFAETVRKVKNFLRRREAPSRPVIVKLVQKFELLGQVSDVKSRTRNRRARKPANIASVAHSVERKPRFVHSTPLFGNRHFVNDSTPDFA